MRNGINLTAMAMNVSAIGFEVAETRIEAFENVINLSAMSKDEPKLNSMLRLTVTSWFVFKLICPETDEIAI